jgi:tetratricopeptide (TPR) repeat protein
MFVLSIAGAHSQSFKEQYEAVLSKDNPEKELRFLQEWEMAGNNEAELYTAFFNYYINASRKENIAIGKDKPDENKGKYLELNDPDSTKNAPAGYIYNDIVYDKELLAKAFYYAEKGIKEHPSRLDIRFGLVYVYGLIGDYDSYTKEIIRTIDYSSQNNNKWLWTDDKQPDDGKKVMLDGLQGYILQLYETGDNRLLNNMMQIAETTLKYYPDNVESLSNLSIVYLLWKEYDKALESLHAAEKLAPFDFVVLGNIAQAYKLKRDKKRAIEYYESIVEHGDSKAKKYAQSQIEILKKQ